MKVLHDKQFESKDLKNIHGGINFTGPSREAADRERKTTKEKATATACFAAVIPGPHSKPSAVACVMLSLS